MLNLARGLYLVCGCRYVITQPTGMCGDVQCNSGCQNIPGDNVALGPASQPTMFFLDGSAGAAGNCTDLLRAFNAVQAGAAGVIIGAPQARGAAYLTPKIDPGRDDIYSIPHVDVPVGAVISGGGAT